MQAGGIQYYLYYVLYNWNHYVRELARYYYIDMQLRKLQRLERYSESGSQVPERTGVNLRAVYIYMY